MRSARLASMMIATALTVGCAAPAPASAPPPEDSPTPASSVSATSPAAASSTAASSTAATGAAQPIPIGHVDPGRYRIGEPFSAPFDVTLAGDDWSTYSLDPCCTMIERNHHVPPGLLFFTAWTVDEIYEDPCEHTPIKGFGPAAADLAAAFRSVPGYHASEPVDVVVGGMPAKRLTISIPAKDVSDCAVEYRLWGFDDQNTRFVPDGYPDGEDELWIVDVGGSRIVIGGMLSAPTDADRAEFERMVDSIAFVEP